MNLNIHFHMLFLDGAYIDGATETAARFRWDTAPTSEELAYLVQRIARRVGRFLEREGLLARDAESSHLDAQVMDEEPMNQLREHSITYRIAVGPQAGRKVFSLQTLPAGDPQETFMATVGKVAGFSLHAAVAARADERKKLERLCQYDVQGSTSVAGAGMRRSDPVEDPVPRKLAPRA